jgi:hypothetical protein
MESNQNQKILTQMVQRFSKKHGRPPARIVVAPVALVALGLKKSVSPLWEGIPVECRLFSQEEVTAKHDDEVVTLGIFVKEKRGRLHLVACDLKPPRLVLPKPVLPASVC